MIFLGKVSEGDVARVDGPDLGIDPLLLPLLDSTVQYSIVRDSTVLGYLFRWLTDSLRCEIM